MATDHELHVRVTFDEAATKRYVKQAEAAIAELGARGKISEGTQPYVDSEIARARRSVELSQIPQLSQLKAISSVRATVDAARQRLLAQNEISRFQGSKALGLPAGEAGYTQLLARAQAVERKRYAAIDRIATEQLTANRAYLSDLAATRRAERLRRARIEAIAAGEKTRGRSVQDLEAGNAFNRSREALARRALVARRELSDPSIAANRGYLAYNRQLQQVAARSATTQQIQGFVDPTGRLRGEEGYRRYLGESAAAEKARATAIRRITAQQLAANQEYIADVHATDEAQRRQRAKVAAAAYDNEPNAIRTKGRSTAAIEADVAERQKVTALRQSIQSLQKQNAADNQMVQLKAQELVEQRRVNALRNAEARRIQQQAIALDPSLRGTRFQRIQAGIAERQGGAPRLPTEYLGLGQFLRARALTTAGFAVSGLAIYGTARGIAQSIRQAEQLQRIFNQIQQQFESLGQTSAFDGFRKQIFAIARETGVAADEVANVGFQFQGAFGGDTARAIHETESAMKAVQVTGLEIREVIDAFTAITQSFKDQRVSIDELTDKALGLQERFGVLAKETISFASDLAPVAASMGFTAQQLEVLGAVAQKYSGRSGSSLAEAFGRVLPSIQENAPRILELFSRTPQLVDDLGAATQAFASGDIEAFFTILQNNFAGLDRTTKNFIADLLGGRRETAAIIATLEHGSEVTGEYANITQDAGKAAEYFNRLQSTLAQTLARLREQLKQVGVAIFEAGLGQALTDLGDIAGGVARIFGLLLNVFSELNETTHGLAGRLVEVYLALRLISGLGALAGVGRVFGGVGARLAARRAAGTVALDLAPEIGLASGSAAAARAARFGPAAARAAYQAQIAAQVAGARGGAITRGGAGLVGFLGGPQVVIGASIAATAYVGYQARNKTQQEARNLAERIRTYDRARVEQIAHQRKDIWDTVGSILAGTSVQEVGKNEILRRNFAESTTPKKIEALVAQGLDLTTTPSRRVIEALARQGYGGIDRQGRGLKGKLPPGLRPRDVRDSQYRITVTDIKALQKTADDTTSEYAKASQEALNLIVAEFSATPAGRGALEKALTKTQIDAANAQNKARADKGEIIKDASNAKELYEAGIITIGEYVSTLDNARTILRNLGPNYARQLAEIDRQIIQFEDEKKRQITEAASEFRELAGTETPSQRLADLRSLLPQLRDPKQRSEVAKQIVEATKADLEFQVEHAKDTAEARRILQQGVAIDPATQDQLNIQTMTELSVEWSQFLKSSSVAALGSANLAARIAAEQRNTHVAARQALQQIIQNEIAAINVLIAHIDERPGGTTPADERKAALLGQKRRDLEAAAAEASNLPDLPGAPGTANLEEQERRRKDAELAKNLESALVAREKARAGGDALADANLAIRTARASAAYARAIGGPEGEVAAINAEAEMLDALRAQHEAQRDIAVAELELLGAQQGSPVTEARAQQEAANAARENARGRAAILRAEAEQVRSNRAVADAIRDVRNAEIELLIAYSDAAGTTVESARLQAVQAAEELAHIQATRPGDEAGILRARAEAVSANAAVRDADLAQRKEDIQFAMDMEQVTTGQAIAQFEALLQIPNLTQEQTRDILRTIKQLRDQLSQDLQFNLPTDLRLPTLYEARRLNQGAGGYQDNRQVQVTMYINNGMDQRQAEQMLNNALGSNRYGFTSRRY